MAIVTRTKTYAVCPSCGADAGCVDHLLRTTLTTSWYCDSCGERYSLAFSGDGSVDIQRAPGRKVTTLDLLVLKPQTKPVFFIVPGMRFEGEGGDDDHSEAERKEFYYNEHSCPTNWLKPEMVYFEGDDDPHGLIEFVATADDAAFPPDESYGPNPRDRSVVEFIERSVSAMSDPAVGQRAEDPI